MNRTAKVFLACAIGALVGSLVALQFKLFWWVGLLAGGFTGYLSYEFGTVIRMIPRAWRMATSLRVNWNKISAVLLNCFASLFFLPFAFAVVIFSYFIPGFYILDRVNGINTGFYLSVFVSGVVFFLNFAAVTDFSYPFDEKKFTGKNVAEIILKFNPVTVSVWYLPRFLFWILPRAIFRVLIRVPEAIIISSVVLAIFIWHLFRLIHSDERVLCAVNAGIGTIVGFIAGNALVGAFAGGILGVLSYEILSKRVFHFVPIHKPSN